MDGRAPSAPNFHRSTGPAPASLGSSETSQNRNGEGAGSFTIFKSIRNLVIRPELTVRSSLKGTQQLHAHF